MTLDLTPLSQGVDASALLQAALDAGGPVEIPPVVLTLARPVYLSTDCDLSGRGATLSAPNRDALVAMPAAVRHYDPAAHVVPNAIDPARWAFRSHGTAGLRYHNTPGDSGWSGSDHWAAVRGFAVETHITRHGGTGCVCGAAWGASTYRPAPWYLSQFDGTPDRLDFVLAVEGKTDRLYRVLVGPAGGDVLLRVRVDLDAGTVLFDVNGAPVADVLAVAPIAPGDVLRDNPGAPLWLGGVTPQAGGACPPGLKSADVTIHTFRIWKTADPPTTGYGPHAHHTLSAFAVPFDAPPVAGDPAVSYVGTAAGFGYLTPTAAVPSAWAHEVSVRDLMFFGADYGAGLTFASVLDIDVSRVRVQNFAVGLQVLGGPLPNYPVRLRDIFGLHQRDCVIRLQRCIAREVSGVTAKYPRRSVLRADNCGTVCVRDLIHAGENSGELNTVTDVIRSDSVNLLDVSGVLSNYEDGWGPRRSYLRITGAPPEPGSPQIYRVKDFPPQALRPGAQYLDRSGLPTAATGEVLNSF